MSCCDWAWRVLGRAGLSRCADPDAVVPLEAALRPRPQVLALFFLPAGGGAAPEDHGVFTARLLDLYRRLNDEPAGAEEEAGAAAADSAAPDTKRLEVVQVPLTNVDTAAVALEDAELAFRKAAADLPWLAVPFHDMHRKTTYLPEPGPPTTDARRVLQSSAPFCLITPQYFWTKKFIMQLKDR
ncbi:uncharacterized protein LOC124711130 [Schistocerca piceifrons]|uniref:uncharacterized protein LOC124711130 n=1 Tax=Schistocerca piceifrons TaxID=274613 RepID=UPI001F5EA5D3|nr:uncharacterized protein LOC124711130 [Schistocerca piceifrons]